MFWKKKKESNDKEATKAEAERTESEIPVDKSSSDYIERLLESNSQSSKSQKHVNSEDSNKVQLQPTKSDILPCDHFQYEIKRNCGRLARFNRMFMSDSEANVNCDLLNDLFFECRKYTEDSTRNLDSLVKLKNYENELVAKRIQSIKNNNVWDLRKEPPSDWNAELPDWAKERGKESYWYKYKDNKA